MSKISNVKYQEFGINKPSAIKELKSRLDDAVEQTHYSSMDESMRDHLIFYAEQAMDEGLTQTGLATQCKVTKRLNKLSDGHKMFTVTLHFRQSACLNTSKMEYSIPFADQTDSW